MKFRIEHDRASQFGLANPTTKACESRKLKMIEGAEMKRAILVLALFSACICVASAPAAADDSVMKGRAVVLERYPKEFQIKLKARDKRREELAKKSSERPRDYVAVDRLHRWKPGSTVRVAFYGGDVKLHRKIEKIAHEWTKYGNIKFDFGFEDKNNEFRKWDPADKEYAAEIRISFDHPDGGYWSFVGRECDDQSITGPGEASMNLQGFHRGLPADWDVTVLHEFGHSLGFHHEHQNPKGGCEDEFRFEDDPEYDPKKDGDWGRDGARPGVYTVLGWQDPPWSKCQVDENLRRLPAGTILESSEHDVDSIMHYRFEEWMFKVPQDSLCHKRTPQYAVLSSSDKLGMSVAYMRSGDDLNRFISEMENDVAVILQEPELHSDDQRYFEGVSASLGE
jgi:hypothetical protein